MPFRHGKYWPLSTSALNDNINSLCVRVCVCRSEDYIHRIGRTGRRQTGTAYTFFTSANSRQARELIGVLEEAGQKPEPALLDMARINSNGKGGGRCRYNVRLPNQYMQNRPVTKPLSPAYIPSINDFNLPLDTFNLTGPIRLLFVRVRCFCSR